MLILDTNHYRDLAFKSAIGLALAEKLFQAGEQVSLTVISADEVLSGWLKEVRGQRFQDGEVIAYRDFQEGLEALSDWFLLPWTPGAVGHFNRLRNVDKLRVGTMDLRIASIALEHDAKVLTRNLVDFEKVPGLRVENWLD
jgi:tRNA(fMet)-specific endonuclease VapC